MIAPNGYDLLPCPFCGSERLENLEAAEDTEAPVMCIDCGARGPCKAKAIEDGYGDGLQNWNSRR